MQNIKRKRLTAPKKRKEKRKEPADPASTPVMLAGRALEEHLRSSMVNRSTRQLTMFGVDTDESVF